MHLSEHYRLKALACEKLGLDATDPEIKFAWAEIAIEWHALASGVANNHGLEIEVTCSPKTPPVLR